MDLGLTGRVAIIGGGSKGLGRACADSLAAEGTKLTICSRNAEELVTLIKRGMTPLGAIRAATIVSADLIDAPDLGRIAPGMLADIIGMPGDPLTEIQRVQFVMKDGKVHRR